VVKIYNDYKDRVDFLTVYVREAHPTDEWQMKSNVKEDVCYAQPKTLEQRVAIANDFVRRQKYPLPFGIDDMTNAADLAYSAWPERFYIIDEHGRIAYAGGMGPFKYNPDEVRAWLTKRFGAVTQTTSTAAPAAAATSTPAPAAAPASTSNGAPPAAAPAAAAGTR
jgi:iodothyronine deiodinase-like protein